ncbi:MAG: hypothetical protein JKY70_02310 [Mucilaginibacter sp.]|nr:hypothetical protein [Mucilaginibacter sp.]
MNFYLQVFVAFVLVGYPALLKLKTDGDKPYFRELFVCTFGGAILSLVISVNSHRKELVNFKYRKEK